MIKKTGDSSNHRSMKVRVKTAKGRKLSSTLWLQRQLNDPYVQRAKRDGFRSRATYKILEMNEKHRFLVPSSRVIDLGCAPGGWLQVASDVTNSSHEKVKVVGIDYLELEPVSGCVILQKNFLDEDAPQALLDALGGHAPTLVMSDMAAPTTGHKQTDHLRTTHLFEVAAEFARESLEPGGTFLSKVFRGGTEHEQLRELKRDYTSIAHLKPPASRKESPELYVLARGFRGR
ncbi:MAG: RlmE family RNA methyltransferase [Cohaesibacteraceae bacterium]|nr:RlmE family RNA methyltransferase [Cohaesibacteraceae bacterium]